MCSDAHAGGRRLASVWGASPGRGGSRCFQQLGQLEPSVEGLGIAVRWLSQIARDRVPAVVELEQHLDRWRRHVYAIVVRRVASECPVRFANAPALRQPTMTPEVERALPFVAELRQAVETAKTRPISPKYLRISRAIHTNVNAALRGRRSPEAALKAAHRQINQVLKRKWPRSRGLLYSTENSQHARLSRAERRRPELVP